VLIVDKQQMNILQQIPEKKLKRERDDDDDGDFSQMTINYSTGENVDRTRMRRAEKIYTTNATKTNQPT